MFEDIQSVYAVGAGVFGVCTLITSGYFAYYVSQGLATIKEATRKSTVGHAHWRKSLWMYLCTVVSFFLLTFLYVENSFGNGFRMKINMHVINVLRWIILGIIAVIYNSCLAFILTEEDDVVHPGERLPLRAQSVMAVLFQFVAVVLFYFATISTSESEHWTCIIFSFFSFVASVLLYFFPYNKFTLASNLAESYTPVYAYDSNGVKQADYSNLTPNETVKIIYRWVVLALLIFAHLAIIIIWFFSRSNDIIDPSWGLDLLGEAIAYLVIDAVVVIGFTLTIFVLSGKYHQNTMVIFDPIVKAQPLPPPNVYEYQQQQPFTAIPRSHLGITAVRDYTR